MTYTPPNIYQPADRQDASEEDEELEEGFKVNDDLDEDEPLEDMPEEIADLDDDPDDRYH